MNAFEEKVGKYASATLVSAKTGEILATTQRPTYDADTKQELDKRLCLEDRPLHQISMNLAQR